MLLPSTSLRKRLQGLQQELSVVLDRGLYLSFLPRQALMPRPGSLRRGSLRRALGALGSEFFALGDCAWNVAATSSRRSFAALSAGLADWWTCQILLCSTPWTFEGIRSRVACSSEPAGQKKLKPKVQTFWNVFGMGLLSDTSTPKLWGGERLPHLGRLRLISAVSTAACAADRASEASCALAEAATWADWPEVRNQTKLIKTDTWHFQTHHPLELRHAGGNSLLPLGWWCLAVRHDSQLQKVFWA